MTPRILFGPVAVLAEELDDASLQRALVVTTPGRQAEVRLAVESLGGRVAGLFAEAAPHVPVASVDSAEAALDSAGADVLVALGGGSAIGLAKALALRHPLPIAALPTTYAGSEMTNIWGLTEGGRKRTGRDARVAPRIVVYDAALTLGLPPHVSAASGMNAMAHAAEALYAGDATDEVLKGAVEAARLLAESLPTVVAQPGDLVARDTVLRGAHLAGTALGRSSMGLHHRLCHVLGGSYGLPHAMTHAVVLPHVVAFNTPAAPAAMGRLARAIGAHDAASGLVDLNDRLGIKEGLGDLGLRHTDLEAAATLAAEGGYPNPRSVTAEEVRGILAAAF